MNGLYVRLSTPSSTYQDRIKCVMILLGTTNVRENMEGSGEVREGNSSPE